MAKGSCLCGKVTFSVGGKLFNMSHCHCSMCRTFHGSLFATYIESTELSWTSGIEFVQTFPSSSGFTRAFCKHCGSVLPETSADGEHAIPAGLLDDDPGIRPEAHIFTESRAEAYTIHGELPQLTHYGDGDNSRVIERPVVAGKEGVVSGGCLCGDVAFEYSGTPKFMMNCHCSRCRKVKGAAHASNVFVVADQFRWVRGETRVSNYDLPDAERFGHAFCERCGSSMPRFSSSTGLLNVPAGSLHSAPGAEPRGHIYVGSKAPWFDIEDELPQWDEIPG